MEWLDYMKIGLSVGLTTWLFIWGLNRIYLYVKNMLS